MKVMTAEDLIGRIIWLEMDEDRSAVRFSPRKARVVHMFEKVPMKEAVAVELEQPVTKLLPVPRKLKTLVLQYHHGDQESLTRTFSLGHSYAEVLRLKKAGSPERDELKKSDIAQIGFANVFPWPVLTARELKTQFSKSPKSSSKD